MKAFTVAFAAAYLLPGALAWGAAGHEIVATIAQIHLHPSTRQRLCEILPERSKCHLATVAAWADTVRRYYPETAPMHYINPMSDHPSDHCEYGEHGWLNEDVNVLTGIMNETARIMAGQGDIPLRFLVHFMGDMHQPLHLTGRDKGGNGAMFLFEGHQRNLHSVWDSGLITKKIREISNYTSPLPSRQIEDALPGAIFDPYVRWIVWEGIRQWWRDELPEWLTCPADGDPFPHSSISDIPASTPDYLKNRISRTAFSALNAVLPAWITIPFQLKYPVQMHETHGFADQLLSTHPAILNGSVVSTLSPDPQLIKPVIPACPFSWSKPIHQLNCDIVWPKNYVPGRHIELDTKDYLGRIDSEKTLEKLLAMGGIRLASILNTILGDETAALNLAY
ncbi:phospholipase C/P1 nuclease domain-containing protein [Kockovaella imperatae]|uniref:Phospholipase C/P1 nuclease domain-containing protein n=1 Tax=Kockovaella imperatae TaxID=4999 RepID=A0A1Y1UFC4_9TREE|nr:phospholipase C/P1 nuclease domain-containing protein [Kockovaella imperatae]ORX36722.1 phospholipase C/P1 nuclease domain-containing protein [Kockovaella imperatae]